jgi:hypothetical protein
VEPGRGASEKGKSAHPSALFPHTASVPHSATLGLEALGLLPTLSQGWDPVTGLA